MNRVIRLPWDFWEAFLECMRRVSLLALGLISLWWSTATLPFFHFASPVRDTTARIVADEHFKPNALIGMLAYIERQTPESVAGSSILRGKALLRLELAEKTMGRFSGTNEGDRQTIDAVEDVKRSLSQNPSDSFLWLLLYSVTIERNGFDPTYVKYLIQSYQTGPNEGWVAMRRNSLSLRSLPLLDESLKLVVTREFAQIVDAGFSGEAALILEGVGWVHREKLLPALAGVDYSARRDLYGRLSADGYKLKIPGIPYDERPWR